MGTAHGNPRLRQNDSINLTVRIKWAQGLFAETWRVIQRRGAASLITTKQGCIQPAVSPPPYKRGSRTRVNTPYPRVPGSVTTPLLQPPTLQSWGCNRRGVGYRELKETELMHQSIKFSFIKFVHTSYFSLLLIPFLLLQRILTFYVFCYE